MGLFSKEQRVDWGVRAAVRAKDGPARFMVVARLVAFWIVVGVVVVALLLVTPLTVFLLVLLPAAVILRRFRSRKRALAIIRCLRRGLMLNHPLPEWLEISGFGERGLLARRLLVLSKLLRQGMSLAAAWRFGLPEMPTSEIALIAQAEAAGSLPAALDRLQLQHDLWRSESQLDTSYLFYLLLAGLIAVASILVVRYSMNHYWGWFPDHKAPYFLITAMFMPQSHLHQMHYRHVASPFFHPRSLYDVWLPYLGVPLLLLLCAILGAALIRRAFFPCLREIPFLRGLGQRLLYYTPIIGGIYRPGQWVNVARLLAQAVRDGRSLPEVLPTLALADCPSVVAGKLARWRQLLQNGSALRSAAEAVGLPRLLCEVLSQPDGPVLAAWLDYVADVYQRRYRRRVDMLRSALIPVSVLILGAFVLVVEYSFWHFYAAVITAIEHKGPY